MQFVIMTVYLEAKQPDRHGGHTIAVQILKNGWFLGRTQWEKEDDMINSGCVLFVNPTRPQTNQSDLLCIP